MKKKEKIRILCVDDDQDLSAMLDLYKKQDVPLETIGTVDNLDKAFETITIELPDIVVLDLSVPGSDPVETIQRIGVRFPEIRVIVYSSEDDQTLIARAIKAGATKHVHKDSGFKPLLDAIYEAVQVEA